MNPVDMMMYGQRTIDELIDRLEPGDWSAIALGVWTTKDLVGHLGAFEVRFGDVLATFLGEPQDSDLMRSDPATFNDTQAAVRRDWSVDEVIRELSDAHRRVMTRAARIPEATWVEVGAIP